MQGKSVLVKVNTGTAEVPEYTPVFGQRGCTISRGTDTTDTTTKDSGNYSENKPTFNNWSVSFDGVLQEVDPALAQLRTEQDAGNQIKVQVENFDGSMEEGLATITTYDVESPHDDVITYSVELTGSGPFTTI